MSTPGFGVDGLELHAGRCVNRRHAGAQCVKCAAACPAQAITLVGQEPRLDEAACVRCGICLAVCPTDALSGARDYESRLVETVANLPLEPVALVCAAHPTPASATARVRAAVQHRRCLGALAPAYLLELSAGGCRPLWVDDSPCERCSIGAAQAVLREAVEAARALLHAAGCAPAIMLHSEQPQDCDTRTVRVPLYDGAQPAMSRRSFLARFRPSQGTTESPEEDVEDWLQRGVPVSMRLPQEVPASRRRLLAAVTRLGAAVGSQGTAKGEVPLRSVTVDGERCSACGLCARFCPTGALQFTAGEGGFQLALQPAACVDCGVCAAACPEGAVVPGAAVDYGAFVTDEVVRLAEGPLVRCTSCGAWTAQKVGNGGARCHVCRQGAGVVTSLRDDAGLMNDLLRRIPNSGD